MGRGLGGVGACVLAMLLAGCVGGPKVESHADWLAEATRTFPDEAPERVIAAAETVLRHADPGDFTFDYRAGGFRAERKFLIYAVLAAADGVDRWTFGAARAGGGTRASVWLRESAQVHGMGGTRRASATLHQVGTFRLFYARIDYLLGRRPDWVACREAPAKLGLPADSPGTSSLCGLTLQGRDAPPPPPVPRVVPTVPIASAEPPFEAEE